MTAPGPASLPDDVRAAVERAVGSAIIATVPAVWGSQNSTWAAALDDGREVVVQVLRDAGRAAHRADVMRTLGPLTDLPLPRVLAAGTAPSGAWLVTSRVAGEPGYVRAGGDLSDPRWPELARAMGGAVVALQRVPPDRTGLPALWADVDRLVTAARTWAVPLRRHLSAAGARHVDRVIDSAPAVLGRFTPVVAHGDLGPQNALFIGDRLTGLVDLEEARLAHPLLDAAWWNWLVRAHTPAAFARSWSAFLEGAGLDPDAPGFDARIELLTVLRLLETAETFRRTQPEKHASWGRRVEEQLASMSALPAEPDGRTGTADRHP